MTADWAQSLDVVGRALAQQRYRYVDPTSLTLQAVRFPVTVGDPLDSVLAAVSSQPNWVQVGQQLATLKENPGFGGVWIRRDKEQLDLVIVYGFTGRVTAGRVNTYVSQNWETVKHLPALLGSVTLDNTNLAVLARAFSAAVGVGAPTKLTGAPQAPLPEGLPPGEDAGPLGEQSEAPADINQNTPAAASSNAMVRAAGVLNALLALSMSRSAESTVLLIGLDGFEKEAIDKVQTIVNAPYVRQRMWTGLLDADQWTIHGQTYHTALNLRPLIERIRFLLGVA